MKKFLIFILVLSMCLLMIGCSGLPSLPSEPAPADNSSEVAGVADTDTEPSVTDEAPEDLLPEEAIEGQIMIKINK